MVWACIEKRGRIRRQQIDGGGGAGEKKERKTEAGVFFLPDLTRLPSKEHIRWQ